MGKYELLGQFLRRQAYAEVPMTFDEIEEVIGAKLPPKAQHHRAWWSNSPSNNVMTKVWLDAGFRSEQVDMAARKLVFKRDNPSKREEFAEMASPYQATPKSAARPSLFGALKGLLRVAPGVDLTAPADEEWADLAETKAQEGR